MGWHQTTTMQSQQAFLAELLGIDLDELIQERLLERGLRIVAIEKVPNPEAENDIIGFVPEEVERITLSDGSVWVQRLVSSEIGNNSGIDVYAFVAEKLPDGVMKRCA